jgi:hypothetical protein
MGGATVWQNRFRGGIMCFGGMMVISGSKVQNTELQYDDGFCWDLFG